MWYILVTQIPILSVVLVASVKYKNLKFPAGFHYRLGFDIINGVAIETQGMNNRNNQSKAVLNRWRVRVRMNRVCCPVPTWIIRPITWDQTGMLKREIICGC